MLVVVLVGLVLAVARTAGDGVLALADDVHLEVHARDRRLHARRLSLDVLEVLVVAAAAAAALVIEVSSAAMLLRLGDGLVHDRLLAIERVRARGLLAADDVLGGDLLGLLGLLVDVVVGALGHFSYFFSISAIGCGCCAACGWSGPA